MEKEIKEIPFGAKDSELYKFEYSIPEGYEARIEDGKVIIERKESEDERIREGIVETIRQCTDILDPKNQKRMLDWLEKQKESQPLVRDGEIEDKKRDIVAAIRKYYQTDYAEYLTSFLKGLSPEDNSEDEYGQEMLGIAYKLMYEHIPENLRTQEFWDSLKFMREYTGKVAIIHSYEQKPAKQLGGTFTSYDMAKTFTEGQNYVIAHPEKFGLCKPAEWSDEEKKHLYNAIEAVKYVYDVSEGTSGFKCVEFLKSLRPQPKQGWSEEDEKMRDRILEILNKYGNIPVYGGKVQLRFNKEYMWLRHLYERFSPQPHWKPSYEQMKALEDAFRKDGGNEYRKVINSLYRDLKKLL